MHFLFSLKGLYNGIWKYGGFNTTKTSLVSEFDVLLKQQMSWLKLALCPDSTSPKNSNFSKPKWA